VQRELENLSKVGLINRSRIGSQVFYQANRSGPVFGDIRALVAKTVGMFHVLRSALEPLAKRITVAFVYGSIARHEEKADSDVDVMIVGKVTLDEVLAQVGSIEVSLGRAVNPTVYSIAEFKAKFASGNHFLNAVIRGKKVFLFGDEDELREMGGVRLAGGASEERSSRGVNTKMRFDSIEHIRQSGFGGFVTVSTLQKSKCNKVPHEVGVYLVLRPNTKPPYFLDESIGGHFKGKNPTVAVRTLEDKWVDDALVVNIGKAGPGVKRTLKCRLLAYMQFGEGMAVAHWGGRYIWQLDGSGGLLVCWKETPDGVPRNVEKRLISEFMEAYQKLPFANLQR
jgi:predicted nucleotidyltransferase